MAYDGVLAGRLRDRLRDTPEITEKKMFGGLVFLVGGTMAIGVYGDDLLVRVDPEKMASTLDRPDVHPFTMSGRATRGFVTVAGGALDDGTLDRWITQARAYVATLPPR